MPTSAIVDEFITFLGPRAQGTLRGTARLVIKDEGAVMLDENGARAGDEDADVVLIASEATFRKILSGEQNPIMAVMSGKLKVEGNRQRALKVSSILVG